MDNSINIDQHTEPVIQRRTLSDWQKLLRTWKHQYHLEILKIVHHEVTTEDECTIYLLRTDRDQQEEVDTLEIKDPFSDDNPF